MMLKYLKLIDRQCHTGDFRIQTQRLAWYKEHHTRIKVMINFVIIMNNLTTSPVAQY